MPEDGDNFIACTNHYRKRAEPTPCRRYEGLTQVLGKIGESEGTRQLDAKRVWKMLRGVSMEGIITHHSAVFEPNKRLMHVAFAADGKHAPQCKKITLDVAKLLAGPPLCGE
jgi:hypothetical protein